MISYRIIILWFCEIHFKFMLQAFGNLLYVFLDVHFVSIIISWYLFLVVKLAVNLHIEAAKVHTT